MTAKRLVPGAAAVDVLQRMVASESGIQRCSAILVHMYAAFCSEQHQRLLQHYQQPVDATEPLLLLSAAVQASGTGY